MNIRDLKYLVAVHDLNNFSKAAERCFVSQPTLSGQLKKLEQELNTSLIERSTRQVLFTPVGEQVVALAREVLHSVDNIHAAVKAANDPMEGDFHIGLIPTVGPFLLPLLMPEISRQFPKARLFLYELQTDALLNKLRTGELDAVVLAKLDWAQSVNEIPLYKESMRLAVGESDRLSDVSGKVQLDVLEGRSMLMLEGGHCLREQALGYCFAAGAHEDERFKATSLDTLLHMVAAGSGSTLIPDLAARTEVPGVTYLSFEEPQPMREVVMLTRSHSARIPALKAIAECISSTYSKAVQPECLAL